MAKTVFDSSELKRSQRQQVLEEELLAMQAEVADSLDGDSVTPMPRTLPGREERAEALDAVDEDIIESADSDATSFDDEGDAESTAKAPVGRRPEEYSEVLRRAGKQGGAFSSFVTQPRNMRFENQHEREIVLLVLRQHPIVNLKWVLITIFMILLPGLLGIVVPFGTVFPGIFSFFASLGWYLLTTAFVIESFLHWYFNIYIITDERIIDVDFYSLIYKEVSEAKLEKIEDVTATTAGFLGAIFNYGTIAVQTAAEKRQFEFAAVPQPATVTKFLNELILEEEREKVEGRVM